MEPITFKERLERLIGDEKPFSWATRVGVAGATFSRMWNDGVPPKADSLEKIAKVTGVSIDWLLTGEGAMMRGEVPGEASRAVAEYREEREFLSADEYVLVPRYDVTASAGPGALVASEQVVDHLAFKREWVKRLGLEAGQLALITAKGDSMEPTVRDGYLLLVDLRQRQAHQDAIYILRFDSELIAKRLQRMFDGSVKIKSDNPAYDEQLVPVDQVGKLNIVGKVVWGGGRM